MMTRILSWGMIAYFLVLGYSLNQHALFELFPTPEQQNVVNAKKLRAERLREKSDSETDIIKSSEFSVKAAEINLEAKILKDEMSDGNRRAMGLISAATVFFISYLLMTWLFYKKFEPEMSDYFISRRAALAYVLFIGLSIWLTAFWTAWY